jgi:hypothetical protein
MNGSADDACRGVAYCRLGMANLWSAKTMSGSQNA